MWKSKPLMKEVLDILPVLAETSKKGENGRIGVIGGSF